MAVSRRQTRTAFSAGCTARTVCTAIRVGLLSTFLSSTQLPIAQAQSSDVGASAVPSALSSGVDVASSTSTTPSGYPTVLPLQETDLLPYPLTAKFVGEDFLHDFDFYHKYDPTQSFVNYVTKDVALKQNLTYASGDTFIMRANAQEVLKTSAGRDSVRLVSKGQWGDGAYIFDLDHLPEGCGTWPALWTVTLDGWPTGGEIDIIEGANSNSSLLDQDVNPDHWTTARYFDTNKASLHTTNGCQLGNMTQQTGVQNSPLCDTNVNNNEGCGVRNEYGPGQRSVGARFNANGGGWYGMWRDIKGSGSIGIYFWERNSTIVPQDVRNSSVEKSSPELWGEPFANFSIPSCTTTDFFNQHVLVINIAFCADFTAATYGIAGCPDTCQDFVAENPSNFENAFFSINSIRIFADPSKNAAMSLSSSPPMVAIFAVAAGSMFLALI